MNIPGHIKIVNVTELERLSCECYETLRKEYDRLLGVERTHRAAST